MSDREPPIINIFESYFIDVVKTNYHDLISSLFHQPYLEKFTLFPQRGFNINHS
ncbi:hypothetical protein VCHA35O135_100130 [Vibrio chagasii]|nr:hypothetical protein VCHA35O135_100130 [Vibrio chagasii]CAH7043163.1 hypothetical protein VCHA36P166_50123 [Vibrio chagasii]